jgi:signal transduction histidine kinase
MPDRLVELYGQVARKVDDLDSLLTKTLANGHDRELEDQLRREWRELVALVALQRDMLGEIGRRTQELSSLSAFLQTHYEREKASLARELHDELGGILTPAKMDLAWLEARLGSDKQYGARMQRLSALIDQGIDLKRRIIENLHPSLLDHLGLATALQWYMDETCRANNLECRVNVSPNLERLASDIEIALYRIVQESVNNAVRHAKAKRIELDIQREKDGLRLRIKDDGVGIRDVQNARKHTHGLTGMHQRMRAINGTFEIASREGEGTRIEVFVPIEAA